MSKKGSTFKFLGIICIVVLLVTVFSGCQDGGGSGKTINQPNPISTLNESEGTCSYSDADTSSSNENMVKALVFLNTKDYGSYQKMESKINEFGGRVTVGMPPNILNILISEENLPKLRNISEVILATIGVIDPSTVQGLDSFQTAILNNWNNPPKLLPSYSRRPLVNDAIKTPEFSAEKQNSTRISYNITTTMSGKVAITILYPEGSNWFSNNWNYDLAIKVMYQVQDGETWWSTKAPTNLTFEIGGIFPWIDSCLDISYEPIEMEGNVGPYYTDIQKWINQIMNCKGYTDGNMMDKVHKFNSDRMSQTGASQAFTIFAVNAVNDDGHDFKDGSFAFAWPGGPMAIIAVPSANYLFNELKGVVAHETGHIFWAYDEHTNCNCTDTRTESHNCENLNCINGCNLNEECIMRGEFWPFVFGTICDCTKGHIGWLPGCGSCVPASCSGRPNGTLCNNGIFCDGNDYCQNGTCIAGSGRNCSDGISCTSDSCNASAERCDHVTNNSLCPSDNNPCTNEVCQNGVGCTSTNNTNSCTDNIACNGTDTCQNGTCSKHSATCSPTVCYTPDGTPCDNTYWCDGADWCIEGTCTGGDWGYRCKDLTKGCQKANCNEQYNRCDVTLYDSLCSDDGKICTTEKCDAVAGCQHLPNANSCDNGKWCDGVDYCNSGNANCDHSGDPCAFPSICDEANDRCIIISCYSNADCNDGDPCTVDTCNAQGTADAMCSNRDTCAVCGDNICDFMNGETSSSCIQDCHCGNGICDYGETQSSCPSDNCSPGLDCGNGICESGETASTCIQDCHCGNGICDYGETQSSCPGDNCSPGPVCGNGICESGETSSGCIQDCHCGNGICDYGETQSSCPGDNCSPGTVCGNNVCESGEDFENCLVDCNGCPTTHPLLCLSTNYCCGSDYPYLCLSGNYCTASFSYDCADLYYCGTICNNDGNCGSGENTTNCPTDCGAGEFCGNGNCGSGESAGNCQEDCPGWCGDGICNIYFENGTCPVDCGGSCVYTLTSPNGGENWPVGTANNITWNYSGNCSSTVNLYFIDANAGNYQAIAYGTGNDGVYSWTIPDNPTTQADVKIEDSNNSSYVDLCDGYFTISASSKCGNGVCDSGSGENSSNCINDCHCGNGICDYGETASSCLNDCHCGNLICDSGETNGTCPGDCPSSGGGGGGGGGDGGGGCLNIAAEAPNASNIGSAILSYYAFPVLFWLYLKRKNRKK